MARVNKKLSPMLTVQRMVSQIWSSMITFFNLQVCDYWQGAWPYYDFAEELGVISLLKLPGKYQAK